MDYLNQDINGSKSKKTAFRKNLNYKQQTATHNFTVRKTMKEK